MEQRFRNNELIVLASFCSLRLLSIAIINPSQTLPRAGKGALVYGFVRSRHSTQKVRKSLIVENRDSSVTR